MSGMLGEVVPPNHWASGMVCQNPCLIPTDPLQASEQRSDLLCEVELFESRDILLPMCSIGQCSSWLIFGNQYESFLRS